MSKKSSIILDQFQLAADPATPPSGYSTMYPRSNGNWYYKNPDGTVFQLGAGGDMVLASIQTITGAKTFNAGKLIAGAGTSSDAPLLYSPTGAVLKTSPVAGDREVDSGGIPYYTHASSERGVLTAVQHITLSSAYTLTSQTAAQKLFNSPTNGAITLASSKTYRFECFFSLSSMSATSGSFGFALGGTATLGSQAWQSLASKISAFTAVTSATNGVSHMYNTTTNTALSLANTNTNAVCTISGGIIRVTTGGTLIPQVSLGIAAAAVVGLNSFFSIWPEGSNTVQSVGNWS